MASTTHPTRMEPKEPDEIQDYDFDFTKRLAVYADTLASGTVVCADLSLTLGDTAVDTHIVKQWTSGGIDGMTYKLVCRVVTTGGRHWTREMYIPVRRR